LANGTRAADSVVEARGFVRNRSRRWATTGSAVESGQFVADVPAIWALSMPPLTRVAVRIDPAGVRLVVL